MSDNDPFFKRKKFDINLNGVYNTDKVLNIIKPRNNSRKSTIKEVQDASKKVHREFCDRDREFFKKTKDNTNTNDAASFKQTQLIQVATI